MYKKGKAAAYTEGFSSYFHLMKLKVIDWEDSFRDNQKKSGH